MGPPSKATTPSPRPGVSGVALRRVGWIVSSPWRAGVLLFVLSVAVRTVLLPLASLNPAWTIGWEAGAVANQLARTGEYANPYALPTGPTAHPVPFYTGVMALIFRLFGATMAAEYARYGLTIVSFSTMYALMPWFAARLGAGLAAGFIGGLFGVLNPLHLLFGIFGILGEEFAAIALGVLMVASLARWISGGGSVRGSILLGAGWGVAFHSSPPLLPVMLGFMAFELWWSRNSRKWLLSAAMVAGVVLACAPWAWRNYVVFHDFFFIRSNFGLELRMGNHKGAVADTEIMDRRGPGLHPRLHPEEAEKVKQWGEMEYMRQARREAVQWIRENPGPFLRLTALRVVHVWFGWRPGPARSSLHTPLVVAGSCLLTILAILGARRILPALSAPQRAALFIPLAMFPLVLYIVDYMPRYRAPIDWILLVLAGAEVQSWIRRRQSDA